MEEVREEIERLLGADPLLHKEAWHRMEGWYKAAVYPAPPPAQVTLKRITVERVDLYPQVPPPGENIPVSDEPFQVEDSEPTEDEIDWSVRRFRNNCYGGPSTMIADHIKGWISEARKEVAATEKAVEGAEA